MSDGIFLRNMSSERSNSAKSKMQAFVGGALKQVVALKEVVGHSFHVIHVLITIFQAGYFSPVVLLFIIIF